MALLSVNSVAFGCWVISGFWSKCELQTGGGAGLERTLVSKIDNYFHVVFFSNVCTKLKSEIPCMRTARSRN